MRARFFRFSAAVLTMAALVACGDGAVMSTQLGSDTGPVGAAASAPQSLAPVLQMDSMAVSSAVVQEPVQRKQHRLALPQPTAVQLPQLDVSKLSMEGPKAQNRVGVTRDLLGLTDVKALPQQLNWQRLGDGSQRAAISVSSAGAKSVRLGLLVKALPGTARLRVYRQSHPDDVLEIAGQTVLQLIDRNVQAGDTSDAARTWWSPVVSGEEATLEVELPPGVSPAGVSFAVPRVLHVYVDSAQLDADAARDQAADLAKASMACNQDVACQSALTSGANAVARMSFVEGSSGYNCTGTLLNNAAQDGTPYFITANHCIATQTVASTLQTDWFYRAERCGSTALSSAAQSRKGGAALLFTTATTDASLLRLNDAPPAGANFLGWNASTPVASDVVGLHHPKGDLLKYSVGRLTGFINCTPTGNNGLSCGTGNGDSGYVQADWNAGTTEGGSSGSGLFNSKGQLVATLTGGNARCGGAGGSSVYGRFDKSFAMGMSKWLSPAVAPSTRTPVYRFFNSRTGAHFYTAKAVERDAVIASYPEFKYESIVFYANSGETAGLNPVYRFYNARTGAHFYTIKQAERDAVVASYPEFKLDGPSWWAQTAEGNGATAVYRFYNATTGAHFYTASAGERDFVIATYPTFKYEQVAYYVWAAP